MKNIISVLLVLNLGNVFAQHPFAPMDRWLTGHAKEMGGRVILVVYKDNRVVYNYSVNNMDAEQKMLLKMIAGRPAEGGGGYGLGEWIMGNGAVSSPGLFGSYPWVDHTRGYCAFLMAFYLKPDGRQERYAALKKQVEQCIMQ